jgi:hypothetical protein
MTEATKEALRDLVNRHGYKLRKRGAEYHLIDGAGELHMSGTLEALARYFDLLETAKATRQRIQFSTTCGMPLYSFDPATGETATP